MSSSKTGLVVPFLIIAVGVGWLLTTLGIAPEINWIWTLGLAVVGFLIFAASGVDKFSVVTGTLFLLAALFSVLRQTGKLQLDTEVPILVIASGVLLLVVRSPLVPVPSWIILGADALAKDEVRRKANE
jgi:hypothetical protein